MGSGRCRRGPAPAGAAAPAPEAVETYWVYNCGAVTQAVAPAALTARTAYRYTPRPGAWLKLPVEPVPVMAGDVATSTMALKEPLFRRVARPIS